MVKTRVETVIVAYRVGVSMSVEMVVGSSKSVVLDKIKVSSRRLRLAAKRGSVVDGGGILVSGKNGASWVVCEVEFLRVSRVVKKKSKFNENGNTW